MIVVWQEFKRNLLNIKKKKKHYAKQILLFSNHNIVSVLKLQHLTAPMYIQLCQLYLPKNSSSSSSSSKKSSPSTICHVSKSKAYVRYTQCICKSGWLAQFTICYLCYWFQNLRSFMSQICKNSEVVDRNHFLQGRSFGNGAYGETLYKIFHQQQPFMTTVGLHRYVPQYKNRSMYWSPVGQVAHSEQ